MLLSRAVLLVLAAGCSLSRANGAAQEHRDAAGQPADTWIRLTDWIRLDIGDDSHEHMLDPEQRLRLPGRGQ